MARYDSNHYNLPFSHIMIIVIILDEDMLDVRMLLLVCWLRNRPSIKYLSNWENGGGSHPKCVQVRTREGELKHWS